MKKIASAMVIMIRVVSLTTPVYAVNSEISSSAGILSPQFTAIGQMSASLTIDTAGKTKKQIRQEKREIKRQEKARRQALKDQGLL